MINRTHSSFIAQIGPKYIESNSQARVQEMIDEMDEESYQRALKADDSTNEIYEGPQYEGEQFRGEED